MDNYLFISHATPEDNDFAVWLYTRLELAGFSPWVDKKGLLGGEEDFWETIQKTIGQDSSKFLLVLSRSSFEKEGVKNEYSYAESIAKDKQIKDFIIVLRIDDVPFNVRIGINKKNVIDFSSSWQDGFANLVKKLKADKVTIVSTEKHHNFDWILRQYLYTDVLYKTRELHYTNWWPIQDLPGYLYCYTYPLEKYTEALLLENHTSTYIKHGNHIFSFCEEPPAFSERGMTNIMPNKIKTIRTNDILGNIDNNGFPGLIDCKNAIKQLLQQSLAECLIERGLSTFPLSKYDCYYYQKDVLEKDTSYALYGSKRTRKKLVGTYLNDYWHYAVSFIVRLYPEICYSFKSHLLFSYDGKHIWEDDQKRHSARRKKGRLMFNKEWRDLLMAFIVSLSDISGEINIKITNTCNIEMPTSTYSLSSSVGYCEPRTGKRLEVLNKEIDLGDE